MASILNKDPQVYADEADNFVRELRKFHDSRGTGFRHLPTLNGKQIDLYLLYWLVTSQGGWEKVNSRNGWEDLLESFDLDPATANGSLAIKQTYLRYLETYERNYFLGDEEEEDTAVYYDEEDSRSRRQKLNRNIATIPLTYNHSQHRVAGTTRSHYGLSTDTYEATDYDRLALSLLSPLPNEQDFAVNVATLLSNEGRHTLKLAKYPRLLDLLLAHAGVFNHSNLRNYMHDNYLTVRNYDLVNFWREVCRNKSVLELIYEERNFYHKATESDSRPTTPKPVAGSSFKKDASPSQQDGELCHDDLDPRGDKQLKGAKRRLEVLKNRANDEMTDSDVELFAVGRAHGTGELTGQRVLQIATILRNLSFEEDNAHVLAKNLTCLRFVLLCVNSAWANLNQIGFDIMSNIASEIQLEEPGDDAVTDLLIRSLSLCIGDEDRFKVISSLDVLNKLCSLNTNEDILQRLIDGSIYSQLVQYLSLHDIHLLITTLECLYSLSSLGEKPCNAIVKTHSAIEMLVSLVTVEAQSYGPKACILMRVVETVPQPNFVPPPPAASAPNAPVPGVPQHVVPINAGSVPVPPPGVVSHHGGAHHPSNMMPQPPPPVMVTGPNSGPVGGMTVAPMAATASGPVVTYAQPPTSHPVHGMMNGTVMVSSGPPTMAGVHAPVIVNSMGGQNQFPMANHQAPHHAYNGGHPPQQQHITVSLPMNATLPQQPLPSSGLQPPMPGSVVMSGPPGSQNPVAGGMYLGPNGVPLSQPPPHQMLRPPITTTANVGGPSGNQQVQLRVSNDEPHRIFCLSWLKATYETAPGKSIEQNIMYKQYLASMHRMGRKEVISAQHYALCIRTLFGGSTGPNKRQLADGKTESHYTGIQVRAQPLPLKLTPAQAAAAQEASKISGPTPPTTVQQNSTVAPPPQHPPSGGVIQQAPGGQVLSVQPGHVVQQGHLVPQGHMLPAGQLLPGQIVQSTGQLVTAAGPGQIVQQLGPQGQLVQKTPQGHIIHQVMPSQQSVAGSGPQGQFVQGQLVQAAPAGQIIQNHAGSGGLPNGAPIKGQIVQNIVNAQGQVIQQRIITPAAGSAPLPQHPSQQVIKMVPTSVGGAAHGGISPGRVLAHPQSAPGHPPLGGGTDGQVVGGLKSNNHQQPEQRKEVIENGMVPLDGLLPPGKDANGKLEKDTNCVNGVVVGGGKDKQAAVNNHVEYGKLNGDSTATAGGNGKRMACEDLNGGDTGPTAPKKQALISQLDGTSDDLSETTKPSSTNGFPTSSVNGQPVVNSNGGGPPTVTSVGGGAPVMVSHHAAAPPGVMIQNPQQQLVKVVPSSQQPQAQMIAGGPQYALVPAANAAGQLIATSSGAGQEIVQSSTGQFYLKAGAPGLSSGAGGTGLPVSAAVLVPAAQPITSSVGGMMSTNQQAVIVQQAGGAAPPPGGKILFIQQPANDPHHHQPGGPPPQQQFVQQVIQQSNGQQVVRQVVMAAAPTAGIIQQPTLVSTSDAGSIHNGAVIQHSRPAGTMGLTTAVPVHLTNGQGVIGTMQPHQVPMVGPPGAATQPQLSVPLSSAVAAGGIVVNGGGPSTAASSPAPCPSPPPVKIDTARPFLCEWAGCMKAFKTPKEVEKHAIQEHCPDTPAGADIPCLWARCDGMKRKRFSLMTHLQDRHCHPQLMKLMAVRRVQIMQTGKSDVPLPPAPPPHPGYAPNAALHAIKRNAQEFIAPKENEMRDEKEGPVTKSIRLTASLILRNLVIYSAMGRSRLRAYESHLSTVALSNVESSRTVAQILYDMTNTQEFP